MKIRGGKGLVRLRIGSISRNRVCVLKENKKLVNSAKLRIHRDHGTETKIRNTWVSFPGM